MSNDEPAICFMTLGELAYGAAQFHDPIEAHEQVQRFVLATRVIHSDSQIMQRFGELKASLKKQASIIPDADILIAACALVRCSGLVTANQRHFTRFKGLRLENWVKG